MRVLLISRLTLSVSEFSKSPNCISYWVDQQVKYGYPAWVEASKTAMDAMKRHMDKDKGVRLKYASRYASTANY